jgi:hypothetical protein
MFYVLSEEQKHKGVEYGIRYALDMYITDEEAEVRSQPERCDDNCRQISPI